MKLKIDKENCLLKDLKVPKGYRLIKDWELLREIRINKEIKELCIKDYVWVENYYNEIRAAFLSYGYDGDDFLIDGYYGLSSSGRSRGVFVKK